jgi:hypothetical protein
MKLFYIKCKEIDKEVQEHPEGSTATMAYLASIKSMRVLPVPLGLINHKGSDGVVKANNLRMGETYGLAVSKSMKHLPNTHTIEMPGNRLGENGGAAILEKLSD